MTGSSSSFPLQLALVMVGGALGSGLRFSVYVIFERAAVSLHTASATLIVNIVGSFLISFFAELGGARMIGDNTRIFLNVGIMGGLTTYSSFNNVLVEDLRAGKYGNAAFNMLLTLSFCLLAGFAGWMTAKYFSGR